ncbi:MAG: hypothetical protein R6U56_08410 [Opitutales bacterium]
MTILTYGPWNICPPLVTIFLIIASISPVPKQESIDGNTIPTVRNLDQQIPPENGKRPIFALPAQNSINIEPAQIKVLTLKFSIKNSAFVNLKTENPSRCKWIMLRPMTGLRYETGPC